MQELAHSSRSPIAERPASSWLALVPGRYRIHLAFDLGPLIECVTNRNALLNRIDAARLINRVAETRNPGIIG
jgi:hypothetical protein